MIFLDSSIYSCSSLFLSPQGLGVLITLNPLVRRRFCFSELHNSSSNPRITSTLKFFTIISIISFYSFDCIAGMLIKHPLLNISFDYSDINIIFLPSFEVLKLLPFGLLVPPVEAFELSSLLNARFVSIFLRMDYSRSWVSFFVIA